GPTPIRRWIRLTNNAPMIEPTLPTAKTTPIAVDERWRSRTAYSSTIAKRSDEKKFELPVHAAMARSHGWRTTKRRPSLTSGHLFERGASSGGGQARPALRPP